MRAKLFGLFMVLALLPMGALAATGTTTPISGMSDYALWAIIAGVASTYIAAVINRAHWQVTTKHLVWGIVGVVLAGVDAMFKRDLDFHNWSRAALLVLASGITWYTLNKTTIKEITTQTT